eukprot:129493-Amphidinium_carterae.3
MPSKMVQTAPTIDGWVMIHVKQEGWVRGEEGTNTLSKHHERIKRGARDGRNRVPQTRTRGFNWKAAMVASIMGTASDSPFHVERSKDHQHFKGTGLEEQSKGARSPGHPSSVERAPNEWR